VITIPTGNFIKEKLLRKDYYCLQHLTYFTPDTFTVALQKSGFKVLKQKPYRRYMKMRELSAWFQKGRKRIIFNALFQNCFLGELPFFFLPDEHIFYVRKKV
jgi:hypothetical protein